jgi:hypothetical protein
VDRATRAGSIDGTNVSDRAHDQREWGDKLSQTGSERRQRATDAVSRAFL